MKKPYIWSVKRRFYINDISCATGYSPVSGYTVEIVPYLDTFVYKRSRENGWYGRNGGWCVTEETTGFGIRTTERTREAAVAAAAETIRRCGKKAMLRSVAKALVSHGGVPQRGDENYEKSQGSH